MPNPAKTDAEFEAFYERHWMYVYRLCRTYLTDDASAEDCVEDVFVKVLTGEYSFEDAVHERKWLTVAAVNLCKDRLKRFDRRNVCSLDDENVPEPAAPEPEEHSDLREAVLALPPKLKDVVLLFYYDGYQTDEIADLLDRPPSTVRNQLRDARNLLKTALGGDQ